MSQLKSYNAQALRGHAYDDHTFQADMREAGIYVPDELLYKPELGPYVINEVHKQSVSGLTSVVNDNTGKNYTAEEAKAEADAKAEAKAKAKAEANAAKPIVSQRLNDAVSLYGSQEVDLSCDIKCVISGDQLKSGSKGFFVNTVGIVSPRCFSK